MRWTVTQYLPDSPSLFVSSIHLLDTPPITTPKLQRDTSTAQRIRDDEVESPLPRTPPDGVAPCDNLEMQKYEDIRNFLSKPENDVTRWPPQLRSDSDLDSFTKDSRKKQLRKSCKKFFVDPSGTLFRTPRTSKFDNPVTNSRKPQKVLFTNKERFGVMFSLHDSELGGGHYGETNTLQKVLAR
jgi:hypothetical protein